MPTNGVENTKPRMPALSLAFIGCLRDCGLQHYRANLREAVKYQSAALAAGKHQALGDELFVLCRSPS